ncbi:hypothetical protein G6F24_018954 [Rhizopus arrhizus]|nr:hypothetical protein G6F24_018954 [Rhizopus arrhizus]
MTCWPRSRATREVRRPGQEELEGPRQRRKGWRSGLGSSDQLRPAVRASRDPAEEGPTGRQAGANPVRLAHHHG